MSAQFDWIDSQKDTMIETMIRWCDINSGSYHQAGIAKMLDTLKSEFTPLVDEGDTLDIRDLPSFDAVDDNGNVFQQPVGQAIIVRKRPELTNRVLLCGHFDTVYPEDHHFQTCKQLDDNTINGPGVADMKGGLVCMLTALKAFEQSALAAKIGWDVLIIPDEEIGSQSGNTLFPQFKDNAFGLLYEPSLPQGQFVGERKGSGNFTIIVRGKSAHAGREFYKGRNAIVKAAGIVNDLWALNNPEHSTTLNVGTIDGGQALNVVPELAIVKFNIRVTSDANADAILASVEDILAKHRKSGEHAEDFAIELHGKVTRPAKPMDAAQDALFDALRECHSELGRDTEIIATGGCCDGNNLKALGLPNIDTMGVRGGNIHSDQEYVLLDSLTERAKLTALMLTKFAQGEIMR